MVLDSLLLPAVIPTGKKARHTGTWTIRASILGPLASTGAECCRPSKPQVCSGLENWHIIIGVQRLVVRNLGALVKPLEGLFFAQWCVDLGTQLPHNSINCFLEAVPSVGYPLPGACRWWGSCGGRLTPSGSTSWLCGWGSHPAP